MTVLDIATGARLQRDTLAANDISNLTFETDSAIVAERYADNRMLGGFILIDRESSETVAMGLVKDAAPPSAVGLEPDADHPHERASHLGGPMLTRLIAKPAETWWRSFAKAVSWRVTGSIDTFILAYLFTGQAKVAAAISGTEIITKIALYFGHERLWQRLAPGRVDQGK